MSIATECPDCFRTYNLPDKYAGKSIRCKSCGGAIRVKSQEMGFSQAPPPYAGGWPPPERTTKRSRARRRGNHSSPAIPDGVFRLMVFGILGILAVGLVIAVLAPTKGFGLSILMFIAAVLALAAAKVMLIIFGFLEDVSQGLLVLFVPFYSLNYLFTRQPRTKLAGQIVIISLIAVFGSPVILVTSGVIGGIRGARVAARRDLAEKKARTRNRAIANDPGAPGAIGRPAPANDPDPRPRENMPKPRAKIPDRTIETPREPPKSPETYKLYLTRTTSLFSPTADHAANIEKLLVKREGYVPGSAKIDLDAGTFTYKARPYSDATNKVGSDLFGLGLMTWMSPPTEPWKNPTISREVKYAIAGTIPIRLRSYRRNLDKAANMALTSRLANVSYLGYVPGSVDVDFKNKIVTMKCYPNYRENLVQACLRRIGIKLEVRH